MNSPRYALGLDIGGTKTAVGVVSFDGRLLAFQAIPTDSRRGTRSGAARIIEAIQRVLHVGGVTLEELSGIGVGCAGPVDPVRGTIHNPHTLTGWEEWGIVETLGRELTLPVWLENDADMAALGEYYSNSGEVAEVLAMLTFGTGVGGAVLIRGGILRGARGEHPELGHMPIASEGDACYCGRSGCLESIASGTALALAGQRAGLGSTTEIFAAAVRGELMATRMLDAVRRAVVAATWTLVHTFAPDRIVLGGGLVAANPELFAQAARSAVERSRLIKPRPIDVVVARLGNQAGLIGAARWAFTCHGVAAEKRTMVSSKHLTLPL